jgi:hypothetical protein
MHERLDLDRTRVKVMRMRLMASPGLLALVPGLAAPLSAGAQESPPRFELTPYAAYRIGGEFEDADDGTTFDIHEGNANGLIFNIRTAEGNTQWEVLYAHQSTELETRPTFAAAPLMSLDVDYWHFGGTYLFDMPSPGVQPFVALTAGLARFEPAASGIEAENYFSGSLGGGVQLRADRRVGVRLEGRVFGSLIDSEGGLFCRSGPAGAACALAVDGDALFQWEVKAGVVFRF